jgi:hypothetical protein
MTEKYFLVANVIQGTVIQQEKLISPTRIVPRILTNEGYERLMGPPGPHRQVSRVVKGEIREQVEFYPNAFSDMTTRNPAYFTVSMAYDQFHSTGLYSTSERWVNTEKQATRTEMNRNITKRNMMNRNK